MGSGRSGNTLTLVGQRILELPFSFLALLLAATFIEFAHSRLHHGKRSIAMLSTRRAQSACPRCRAQLLKLFDASFAKPIPVSSRLARRSISSTSTSARPAIQGSNRLQRTISTTAPRQGESQVENVPAPKEDLEAVVRQARETFGDTLPQGYLSQDEYRLYERLYGAPLRDTRLEDVGIPDAGENVIDSDLSKNTLLRETESGEFEEVEYSLEDGTTEFEEIVTEEGIVQLQPPTEAQLHRINAVAKNQREYDALIKLRADFEAASLRPIEEEEDIEEEQEEPEEEEEEDEDEGEPDATFLDWPEHTGPRMHQYSLEGKFRTSPSTLHLPKVDFVTPITELLKRTDTTHIRQTAEKAFGGPGLPFSPATPKSGNRLPQKPVTMEASHHKMSEIEADTYISTVLPGVYASVTSTLVEVRKRLGSEWLQDLMFRTDAQGRGPRVLDAGAGGAGLAAWQEVLQAEFELMRDDGMISGLEPPGKKTVVVGSDHLRHRISRFLHNTTFLPRLPDYLHSAENAERHIDQGGTPQPRKTYDLIIATHMFMPLEKSWRRHELLDNLWSMLNPEGGVLIILEKGHPRGFEAVADARDRLLNEFIIPPSTLSEPEVIESETTRVREPGMIVAPCTNHSKCPMYLTPGLSHGRKDFCHFSQRFIRPPFLQRVHGATHRNHEDIDFSFIAVRRGVPTNNAKMAPGIDQIAQGTEATDRAFAGYDNVPVDSPERPQSLSLPRNVRAPIKRHGHVTLELCTPAGQIERWTVPRSFNKQAYHDARKAQWGDLWALGAKSRVRRDVRLGKGGVKQDGGVRARAAAESAGAKNPRVVELDMGDNGVYAAREKSRRRVVHERRTKGGRKPKMRDLLKELEEQEQ